jgi:ADP-ribose pyrophosphatase YjhB (NUDIX family)
MVIFINDIPVRILKSDETPDTGRVNHIFDAATGPVTQASLLHHVWVKNVKDTDLDSILAILDSKVPTGVLSLNISVADYKQAKMHIRSKFKIVRAAGGLIRKKDKFLMIYRMKKWDLPKGKKERGERYKQTAVREVQEECNVDVRLGSKICTTWHTYTMNKNAMLKKTRWYVMDLTDDSRMRPATEEDIEETRWMSHKEVYHALEHSYKSISYVIEKYHEMSEMRTTINRNAK